MGREPMMVQSWQAESWQLNWSCLDCANTRFPIPHCLPSKEDNTPTTHSHQETADKFVDGIDDINPHSDGSPTSTARSYRSRGSCRFSLTSDSIKRNTHPSSPTWPVAMTENAARPAAGRTQQGRRWLARTGTALCCLEPHFFFR